jgi:hypothetical protein
MTVIPQESTRSLEDFLFGDVKRVDVDVRLDEMPTSRLYIQRIEVNLQKPFNPASRKPIEAYGKLFAVGSPRVALPSGRRYNLVGDFTYMSIRESPTDTSQQHVSGARSIVRTFNPMRHLQYELEENSIKGCL